MPIKDIVTGQAGLIDVLPTPIYINTNDTLAQVTTVGYLNQAARSGYTFSNFQQANVYTTDEGPVQLKVVISGVNTSLEESATGGDIVLPTIADHIIVSTNTTGTLANKTGTAINDGNIQAGRSTVAGTLISYPSVAASGTFVFQALTNASGNFTTTLTNATSVGQNQEIRIPDSGDTSAAIILTKGVARMSSGSQIYAAKGNATEAANAVTANGMAGLITTSALTTAGGASYTIAWANSHLDPDSIIGLSLQGGTNTVKDITLEATQGTNNSTLTIYNNTAATPLNGTLLIGYTVL